MLKAIWRFLKRVFNDNPYVDYKFISRHDLNEHMEANYEILDVVKEDCVVKKHIENARGEKHVKEYILNVAFYRVGIRENKYIEHLHNKLNIGTENFEEFNEMREQVTNIENELKRVEADRLPLKEELHDSKSRLAYVKSVLGNNSFDNYMVNYDNIQKQRAANSTATNSSRRV